MANSSVLFYISTISGGGAARVMTNLANCFAKNTDCKIIFVTNFKRDEEYPLDVRISRFTLDSRVYKRNIIAKNLYRIFRLRKIIRNEKPCSVLSFMDENNFRLIFATFFMKVRTIISVRSDPSHRYPNVVLRLFAKTLYSFADGIVFQTEQARDWFQNCIRRKSVVLMNQIDEDIFQTKHVGEEYHLAVGRLTRLKRFDLLINAFAKLLQTYPEEKLRIYGDGEDRNLLKSQIEALGLTNNIFLMGKTDNLSEVYSKAKSFILSSEFEGMPNALLEAMSVGVPCISTDCPCGGPAQIISNNVNGLLIPVNDLDAMANALLRICADDSLRQKLGKNANDSAQMFSPEIIFDRWRKYIYGHHSI